MRGASRPFHTANKHAIGEWLVGRLLLQGALRRAFGGVYAKVHSDALRLRQQPNLPIVFCATHSGWWDGHMAYILNKRIFRRDPYVMMEEAQLARYLFFTWVGAFGVDRHAPRAALESVKYLTGVMSEGTNRALWIFPQGTMSHPDRRPIEVYGGAANIARRLGECALVPVALRYDFLMEQTPDAFAHVGAPLMVSPKEARNGNLTAALAEKMTLSADELHSAVISYSIEGYRKVMSGRGSANRNWDRVRGIGRT